MNNNSNQIINEGPITKQEARFVKSIWDKKTIDERNQILKLMLYRDEKIIAYLSSMDLEEMYLNEDKGLVCDIIMSYKLGEWN